MELQFWIGAAIVYLILGFMLLRLVGFKGIKREPEHDDPALAVDPSAFAAAPAGFPSYHKGHYLRTKVPVPSADFQSIPQAGVRTVGNLSIRQRIPDSISVEVNTVEVSELRIANLRYRAALERIRTTSDEPYTLNLCHTALDSI